MWQKTLIAITAEIHDFGKKKMHTFALIKKISQRSYEAGLEEQVGLV